MALAILALAFLEAAIATAQQPGMMQPGMQMQRGRGAYNPQNPNMNPQQQRQNQRQPVEISGTLDAVGSGGMVVDFNGAKIPVAPDKNCKVEVTGSADTSFLKPGMTVRLTAEFDKNGKSTAPVTELEVVSSQAAAMANQQDMMTQQSPAASKTAEAKKGDSKKGGLAASVGTGPATVFGIIKDAKNNAITLAAVGGSSVTADIAPNAAVKVNTNDAHYAQRGDKIDVHGYSMQPPKVIADDVKITITPHAMPDKAKPAAKTADKAATTAAAN
jgi:hypothetical protein